jgi:lipoprotein NlpD
LNGIDDPAKLRIGQTLRVSAAEDRPAASATGGVAVSAARGAGSVEARPLDRPDAPAPVATDPSMKTSPKAMRLPYSEQNLALLSKGEPAPATAQKPAAPAPQLAGAAPKPEVAKPEAVKPEAAKPDARDPDAIEFIWPAKGRLLAGFSEPSNKGLDIAGKPGDPVVAAAPGRVIYTGSGIRGLGKLIVIRHDNNFQSVYAHNREILVKEGQSVTRGQKIGEVGDTDADAPKLHFEIRKSGKPVDPARYLPPS